MRSIILTLMMGVASLAIANTTNPIETKKVNTAESTITWKGKKVTGSHTGTINLREGSLNYDGDMLTGGTFLVDMTTINCTDLAAGSGKEKLEGHLKSDDFFGVANNPTAKFEITKVVSRGTAGAYKVIGNVTIKGKTKEIKFLADEADGMIKAEIIIDRSDFDVKYGSGSFFDNLGDKTIYDEFDLVLNIKY